MSTTNEMKSDRIAEEAADWFIRIREETLPDAEHARFAQWLAESPVHVREYLGVAEAWGGLQSTASWPAESSEELLVFIARANNADVVSLKEATSTSKFPLLVSEERVRVRSLRSLFPLAIAASFAVAIISFFWLRSDPDSTIYTTARGEQRSVVLPDGSIVQLNTLTTMNVHFDDQQRHISLTSGEAFFRVARDTARPFEVRTPHARVRAIGTEFNVYNHRDSTQVAVLDGKVSISPPPRAGEGQGGGSPTLLTAGQQVIVKPRVAVHPATANLSTATAWIQRRIVLDNHRVDEAVEEFNRYNKRQMQIQDPTLAGLRLSGVFNADDPAAFMKYLERIQGVHIHSAGDEWILRRND